MKDMKITVITIKVIFWITIICFISSIPLSFCSYHYGSWVILWINTIIIGLFASSLVLLLSEFVRYKHLKCETEVDLYYNLSLLYYHLRAIISSIDKSNKEPLTNLTSTFLRPQLTVINDSNEKVKYGIIRYCVLHKSMIAENAKIFILQTTPNLYNIISALRNIEIAVNEDILDVYNSNLDSLRQYRCGIIKNYIEQQPIITTTSYHTNLALQKVINLINNDLFNSIESFLLIISKSKSNNFDWEKDKERFLKMV